MPNFEDLDLPAHLIDQARDLENQAVGWYFLIDENRLAGRRLPAVQAVLPWMTRPFVKSAWENNVIGRDSPRRGMTTMELMTLLATHELPDVMSRPSSSKDMNPKLVGKIIGSVIDMVENPETYQQD